MEECSIVFSDGDIEMLVAMNITAGNQILFTKKREAESLEKGVESLVNRI